MIQTVFGVQRSQRTESYTATVACISQQSLQVMVQVHTEGLGGHHVL